MYRGTFAVVSLPAIRHNIAAIRSILSPGVKLLTAVKANGYGHGAVQVARAAISAGADMLGVASLEEGLALRENGVDAPILVFGRVPTVALPVAATHHIDVMMTTDWSIESVPTCHPALQVHLKLDTGMNRLGFREIEEVLPVLRYVRERPDMECVGVFSHFACADAPDRSHADKQYTRFREAVQRLEQEGLRPPIAHLANSAGTFRNSDWHFDMVRVGVSAYGLSPSPDFPVPVTLKPALHLYTFIQRLAWIHPGETVGYGATFQASRRTLVATVPVGYADGYFRILSNRGTVLIRSCPAPVVGNVCMDQMMIDVTSVPGVQVGDCVTLYGRSSPEEWDAPLIQSSLSGKTDSIAAHPFINETFSKQEYDEAPVLSLNDLAMQAGTISYEIMCALSPRVPKVYLD